VFIEGAVPEIRLIDEDRRTLAPEDDHTTTAEFPDDTVRGEVRVPRVGSVDVTWRVGEACRLLTRP
jgi:hypothetical protein